MTILMGIDPGVSTGIAVKFPNEYRVVTTTDPEKLWEMIQTLRPDAVAFEAFHTGGRVDENMIHTIEVVGSIRGVCHILGIKAYGQMPQSRRSFLPDAAKILANDKFASRHDKDALAHLLLLEWRIKEGKT